MQKIFKRTLPHLLLILFFFSLSIVYFSPSVLNGKVMQQGDMQKFEGMVHELANYNKIGGHSAWTGSMFSGMPAYHIMAYGTAPNFLSYLEMLYKQLDFSGASMLLAGLLAFYLLMCVMGIKRWLAIVGAIAFAFASYNFIIIVAGHITKAYTIALMPITIAGFVLLYKRKLLWGAILYTLGVTLSLMNGHIQITYYLVLLSLFIFLGYVIHLIQNKEFKYLGSVTALLSICSLLAVLPNILGLYTNYETAQTSMRGPSELTAKVNAAGESTQSGGLNWDYATMWSYGRSELLTLLVPNAFGGESGGVIKPNSDFGKELRAKGVQQDRTYTYWGEQTFTSGPVYFGAIVCFLFLLGMFVINNKMKWWLLAGALFLTIMALGRNMAFLNSFLFHYMPMYNKFRTPSMALVIPGMVFPIIGMWGLNEIINGSVDAKKLKKGLTWSLSIAGGICAIIWILPTMFLDFQSPMDVQYKLPEWYYSSLVQYRQDLAQSDALRSLLFILAAVGLLLLFMKQKSPDKRNKFGMILGVGLVALILIDLWSVDKRYLNDSNFKRQTLQQSYQPTAADNIILQDKDPSYRVLNLQNTWQETHTSYFHKSIGGYHAAKLRRYQELIDARLSGEIQDMTRGAKSTKDIEENMAKCPSLNMLNARYVIYDPNSPPIHNPYADGNAWFVKEVKMVPNADAEIAALNVIEPKITAVVDQRFEDQLKDFIPQLDTTASIMLTSYKPNELSYTYHASSNQLAVFSEIYYQPGWKSYIDGKEVPHFRADWTLRGMIVPAGEHKIEFKFIPDTYYLMNRIASVSSAIILLMLILAIVYSIRQEIKKEENTLIENKIK